MGRYDYRSPGFKQVRDTINNNFCLAVNNLYKGGTVGPEL